MEQDFWGEVEFMKKSIIILFIFFVGIVGNGAAQTIKVQKDLPKDISSWNKRNSDTILENPSIKARLKRLLGKRIYKDFLESFETINPIEKKGDILFSSGCLIHACTHAESAIAIDFSKNTIHAAIFNEKRKTRYFNEKSSKTPRSISNWAKRLENINR